MKSDTSLKNMFIPLSIDNNGTLHMRSICIDICFVVGSYRLMLITGDKPKIVVIYQDQLTNTQSYVLDCITGLIYIDNSYNNVWSDEYSKYKPMVTLDLDGKIIIKTTSKSFFTIGRMGYRFSASCGIKPYVIIDSIDYKYGLYVIMNCITGEMSITTTEMGKVNER